MILDEVVLHNFGLYKGRQTIPLAPPTSAKPIILFGGLNGGGKTTFVDALQLALYGRSARLSNRGQLSYDEYLRRSINRDVSQSDGAALELQFRQTSEGREHTYRVHRSWSASESTVRERVEVVRDGQLNRVMTEQWGEQVEEFLPVRLSHLFFFDAEKIEALADFESSAALLASAIHSLLGLDLVERLSTDLLVFERRKRTEAKSESDRKRIDELNAAIAEVKQKRDSLVQERARLKNEHDQREITANALEEALRNEGGGLIDERPSIEAERRAVDARVKAGESSLRELVAGAAPFMLVGNLLSALAEQDRREELADQAARLGRLLAERDALLVSELRRRGIDDAVLGTIVHFLDDDRLRRNASAELEVYLRLNPESRDELKALVSATIPEIERRVSSLLEDVAHGCRLLDDADRRLATVPDASAVKELAERAREARRAADLAQAQFDALGAQVDELAGELARREAALATELEKALDAGLEQEDADRVVLHSGRVRATLGRFRRALVMRRVSQIEQLIFDSFQQLLRKRSLVTGMSIDPERFTVELHGPDGRPLPPDRLSAGERQLLAVSMLWGLGRASGRPLPAVIDTPLGRLDASHRTHLVERYFPQASHQVLLLSTDEEIDTNYFDKLKPFVGRAYRLDYEDSSLSTRVEEGYFW